MIRPPGHAAHPQRQVQPQAAGGDGLHLQGGAVAQLHDGPFAELLFDLGQRGAQRFLFGVRLGLFDRRGHRRILIFCHTLMLLYNRFFSLTVYHKSAKLQQ